MTEAEKKKIASRRIIEAKTNIYIILFPQV